MCFPKQFLLSVSLMVALGGSLGAMPEVSWVDRESGESVTLDQFAGEIVVLDYFAFWCAPCGPASRKIEAEIAQHYAQDPTGTGKVRVLGVNVEAARPDKTEKFIAQAGIGHVVDDPAGVSLAAFGARSLPFIVVLDGREVNPQSGRAVWQIAYEHNGLESIGRLREVIDGLRKGPQS